MSLSLLLSPSLENPNNPLPNEKKEKATMVDDIALNNMSNPLSRENLKALESQTTLCNNFSNGSFSNISKNKNWGKLFIKKSSEFLKKHYVKLEKVKTKFTALTSLIAKRKPAESPIENEIKVYMYGQYNNMEWQAPTKSVDLADLCPETFEEKKKLSFSSLISEFKNKFKSKKSFETVKNKREETIEKLMIHDPTLTKTHFEIYKVNEKGENVSSKYTPKDVWGQDLGELSLNEKEHIRSENESEKKSKDDSESQSVSDESNTSFEDDDLYSLRICSSSSSYSIYSSTESVLTASSIARSMTLSIESESSLSSGESSLSSRESSLSSRESFIENWTGTQVQDYFETPNTRAFVADGIAIGDLTHTDDDMTANWKARVLKAQSELGKGNMVGNPSIAEKFGLFCEADMNNARYDLNTINAKQVSLIDVSPNKDSSNCSSTTNTQQVKEPIKCDAKYQNKYTFGGNKNNVDNIFFLLSNGDFVDLTKVSIDAQEECIRRAICCTIKSLGLQAVISLPYRSLTFQEQKVFGGIMAVIRQFGKCGLETRVNLTGLRIAQVSRNLVRRYGIAHVVDGSFPRVTDEKSRQGIIAGQQQQQD